VLRKYLLSFCIVFFEEYPKIVAIACSVLFLLSLILSVWIRPYKSIWSNVSKIIGEVLLFSSWIIVAAKFIPF